MRLKILKDKDQEELVRCPENNKLKWIPECRKECNHFNGYKTLEDKDNRRTLLCKYDESNG
ncbi:MAG: hypothetical protein KGD70_15205 [Candidatus Lokiarchaeota archaeon]|nr:hypothetical protein [Candidatus Lokiarchaeota archaeon]